tara:strand:+ start:975 stop:1115 length:141 start_codon:yes stop_codon:yes gene_type:complete
MLISECCGYPPLEGCEVSGDTVGSPVGICSYCLEHTDFEEDVFDDA